MPSLNIFVKNITNITSFFGEDIKTQVKVSQYLHEHHTQMRQACQTYVFNSYFIQISGQKKDEKYLSEAAQRVHDILALINTHFTTHKFISSTTVPTISDMSFACEYAQLITFMPEFQVDKYENISHWFQEVKKEFPKFEEVHAPLKGIKAFVDGVIAKKGENPALKPEGASWWKKNGKPEIPLDPTSLPEVGRFVLYVKFKIPPGKSKEKFIQLAKEMEEETKKENASNFFTFGKSTESDDEFILLEEWESRATWLTKHRQTPHFKRLFPQMKEQFEFHDIIEIHPLLKQ